MTAPPDPAHSPAIPRRSPPGRSAPRAGVGIIALVLALGLPGPRGSHAQEGAATAAGPVAQSAASEAGPGARAERGPMRRFPPGEDLVGLINGERARVGLPLVAWSPSLARVAEAHAVDLERHPPTERCNAHSWSDQGPWSPCCYTDDGAQARCMWDKPREISRGVYPGNGYEIAAWSSGRITPGIALRMWQGSPAHLTVMLNQGTWSDRRWRAVGAALSLHHAVVWFGEEIDPAPKDR